MLDAIAMYLEVVKLGSFSKVAKQTGIAVSSVSRKIDGLEAELGFTLFNRSSRLLILTDAGEAFFTRANNIIAELDDAKNSMSALNADPKGLLTITAPSTFGRLYVAPAVISFLKRYPLMEIDLHISDEIIDLSARRIDVAIRIGLLPDSDLISTQLAPLRLVACASPEYIARHGHPTSPEGLLTHNCLSAIKPPMAVKFWTFAGVNKGAPLAVRGNYSSNDTHALVEAAVSGLGIVHIASWLAKELIVSGKLVALFPSEPVIASKIKPAVHAVRMPGRSHAAKAQLFIAHLRAEFGEPCHWDTAIAAIETQSTTLR